MTRFRKSEDECETDLDRVLYLLKNSGRLKRPPKWGGEMPCKSILDSWEIDLFGKDKRKQYDEDMYDEKRRRGELKAAREDGLAEGEARGHQAGLAEGEARAQAEMARKMLAAGMPLEQIVQFTGLDAEAVEALTAVQ